MSSCRATNGNPKHSPRLLVSLTADEPLEAIDGLVRAAVREEVRHG